MKFPRAVVIGKFLPPHRGHKHLIDTALAQSRHLSVIVCVRPTDSVPGEIRAAWLRELHPQASVLCIDDRYDADDSALWARKTIEWLGSRPDAVFTSEHYGDAYAKAMGCEHILVDLVRNKVPCSATMIRSNPWRAWEFLEAPVRAWYALRVCVVGAESTGTTTLARDLARALQTVWVPEYGREYCEAKLRRGETEWKSAEFTVIAQEQTRRENEAASHAHRVLICDTNAWATRLWHRR
jgi:HTH-type transcriptional repressor of NAD biosynthesis genes